MHSIRTSCLTIFALGFLTVVMIPTAKATNFSFTGSFTQDDNVQLFNFSVGAPSTVTLETWSYAGGTNAAGTVIPRGGFDPILALFDSSGLRINQNDDGGCGLRAHDALTNQCWDTFLSSSLAAGNYTVSVQEYNNFSIGPNLANGFAQAGNGNFTASGLFGCPTAGPAFNDVSRVAGGCNRDNQWAFDILNVNSAVLGGTPEPSTLLMFGSGLLGIGGIVRRRLSL